MVEEQPGLQTEFQDSQGYSLSRENQDFILCITIQSSTDYLGTQVFMCEYLEVVSNSLSSILYVTATAKGEKLKRDVLGVAWWQGGSEFALGQ